MKKKILFMLINMNVGGTEKALLNMISEIPKDKYDITIFMLEEYGGFLDYIPSEVTIEYFNGYKHIKDLLNKPPKVNAFSLIKKGRLIKAFIIILLYVITKILDDRSLFFKYLLRNYPTINKEYDVAVAYDGPMDFISYFVIKRIKAKKKIQWIHFDVTQIGFNPHFAKKLYWKFQNIFVVSEEARKKLVKMVPILKDRCGVFYNVFSSEIIQHQAKEGNGFTDNFDGLRILTVGRLSFEKGQDLAIRVQKILIKKGYNVRWYCVGEGNSRKNYEQLIREYNLEDRFILLGANPNPYPFIRQCDIYVQPSRHEGYCITLAEARCLKKPIIATDFIAAKEQIRDGETGLITNFNEEELFKAIIKLINSKELCKTFSYNLEQEKFSNSLGLEKLFCHI